MKDAGVNGVQPQRDSRPPTLNPKPSSAWAERDTRKRWNRWMVQAKITN
jgi:hypothetical protein